MDSTAISERRVPARLVLTASLVAITIAALSLRLTPIPPGPWAGLYRTYPILWGGLVAAAFFLFVATCYGDELQWPWLLGICTLMAGTAVAVSYTWGQPFGLHDPWAHYDSILRAKLSPEEDSYPLFHTLSIVLARTLDVSPKSVLRSTSLLAAFFALFTLTMAIRVTTYGRQVKQTTLLAALPAIFLGFISRPFTLAFPYVLLLFWLAFRSLGTERVRSTVLLVVIGILLIPLHPELTLFGGLLLGIIWLVVNLREHTDRIDFSSVQTTDTAATGTTSLLLLAVAVIAYLFFYAAFGARIVATFALVLQPAVDVSKATAPSGTPLLVQLVNHPIKVIEAAGFAAYVLVLAGVTGIGTTHDFLFRRRINSDTAVVILTTGVLVVLFVGVDIVLRSDVINVIRLFQFLPLILAPGVAIGVSRSPRRLAIAMAFLVFVTGLFTAYPSEVTGKTAVSATDQQVEGIEWLGEHNSGGIVGGPMTFWLIQGKLGIDRVYAWAPSKANPKGDPSPGAEYPWQSRSPAGSLVVIDAGARAQARQVAGESGNYTAIRALDRYQSRVSEVYTNGETNIYAP